MRKKREENNVGVIHVLIQNIQLGTEAVMQKAMKPLAVLIFMGTGLITSLHSATIDAVDDNFTANVIVSGTGGVIGDVTLNDLLNGSSANDADINITVLFDSTGGSLSVDVNGNASVAAGVEAGEHYAYYSICEDANASNCDTALLEYIVDIDSDGDGIMNRVDLDDDNDGIPDTEESCQAYEISKNTYHLCGRFNVSQKKNAFDFDPGAGCNTWEKIAFSPDIVEPITGSPQGATPRYTGVVPSPQGTSYLGVASDGGNDEEVKVQVDNLVVGQRYELKFYYASTGRRSDEHDPVSVKITLPDGVYTVAHTPVIPYDPTKWYTHKIQFVATAATADLHISADAQDNTKHGGAGIDGITIAPATCGDLDGDGVPNAYDLDADNDGIYDIVEAGHADKDTNHDGMTDGTVGNNGLDNTLENNDSSGATITYTIPNTDGNGQPDYLDIDADDDGIVDNIEGQTTDGYRAPSGNDTDHNGVDDAYDTHGIWINPTNTDGADQPDYRDTNSDNDGDNDALEGWDTDNDGTANTVPSGIDLDGDGLDDAYDADNTATNPTNGQQPSSFPDLDNPGLDRDWRQRLNTAPTAHPDTGSTMENTTLNVDSTHGLLANDTDPENDLLHISAVSVDTNGDGIEDNVTIGTATPIYVAGKKIGTLTVDRDGSYVFDPAPEWYGTVPTVHYTASDGTLTSDSTLDITVKENKGVTIDALFWIDSNGNGKKDSGEDVLPGATVELLDANGKPVKCSDVKLASADRRLSATASYCKVKTDANGRYKFEHLKPGKYKMRFTLSDDKFNEGYTFVSDGVSDGRSITVDVDTSQPGTTVVRVAAAVKCGCEHTASDRADSLGFLMILMMMGMSLFLGMIKSNTLRSA